MKEEWDYKILDEMGSISRGRSKHRPRNDPSLFGGKYPFIQTADVKNANMYITEYSQTYNDKGLAQSKLWQPGTLCITIAANIADTGILGIPACFPDSVMGFIPFENISDVKFVKYCFDVLQKECQSIAEGTAQDNLSWEKLSRIKFPCPPLPTQQKIASILSAYDDLIENNRRQIKLLEEAALKLYKEWFVKLNFPGHENTKIVDGVPDGWKKEKISDWCRVFTGKKNANQNVEKGVYPFFTCAPDPLLSNDSLYEGKAVIISGNGSYTGRTQFYDGHFDLYQRTYACVKQKAVGYEYMPFIYYSMKVLFEPIKMGGTKGAAIPYIVMNDITDTEFLYNEEICKKYSGFAEITLDKIGALKKQIQLLQLARDKLLPKLMNGEIEV